MEKKGLLTALILGIAISINAQVIDTTLSKVFFSISTKKVNLVDGTFTGFSGQMNFDETNLSKSFFNICIDATTIETKDEEINKHIKSNELLDVEKYPDICFKTIRVEKTKLSYIAYGDLTLHGYTRDVTIEFTQYRNLLTGYLYIKRFDYNIGNDIGKFKIGEDIKIEIKCFFEK